MRMVYYVQIFRNNKQKTKTKPQKPKTNTDGKNYKKV